MTKQDEERYRAAAHAMQTGVALKMQHHPAETSPKNLRAGVNAAMVETGALVKLLVDKGVITWDEWYAELADAMERERDLYQQWITQHFGPNSPKITLA